MNSKFARATALTEQSEHARNIDKDCERHRERKDAVFVDFCCCVAIGSRLFVVFSNVVRVHQHMRSRSTRWQLWPTDSTLAKVKSALRRVEMDFTNIFRAFPRIEWLGTSGRTVRGACHCTRWLPRRGIREKPGLRLVRRSGSTAAGARGQ